MATILFISSSSITYIPNEPAYVNLLQCTYIVRIFESGFETRLYKRCYKLVSLWALQRLEEMVSIIVLCCLFN